MHNKKILIIVTSLILVVIALYFLFFSPNSKIKRQEKEMIKKVEVLGKSFYEEFYYPQIEKLHNKENYLQSYQTLGIKASLFDLSRYKTDTNSEDILKQFKYNNESCDINNTQVIIYPKSPYNAKDYNIEVVLYCGFHTLDLKKKAKALGIENSETMSEKELSESIELYSVKP